MKALLDVSEPERPAPAASPSPSPASEPLYLEFLDGLRALAALFVVLHHVTQFTEQYRSATGAFSLAIRLLHYGHFAVSVFIVISGFCLMLPVLRRDGVLAGGARTFFAKRARRILPPYYCAMAVCLLLLDPLVRYVAGERVLAFPPLADVVTHALMIHNVFPAYIASINNVFWSIAVEWQIYFLFPLLVLLWGRYGGVRPTLAVLCLAFLAAFCLRNTHFDGLTLQYTGLFALGMCAAATAYSSRSPWRGLRERFPWHLAAFLCGALIVFVCYAHPALPLRAFDLPVGLFAIFLLVAASRSGPNRLRTCLSWKPIVFIGTFSYSIYLIHAPLILILRHSLLKSSHLSGNAAFLLMACLTVPLALAFSYLFFLACERPFLNTRRAARG